MSRQMAIEDEEKKFKDGLKVEIEKCYSLFNNLFNSISTLGVYIAIKAIIRCIENSNWFTDLDDGTKIQIENIIETVVESTPILEIKEEEDEDDREDQDQGS